MRKKHSRFLISFSALILSMSLYACTRSVTESGLADKLADIDEETIIYGTSGWPGSRSISEYGILLQSGSTLQLYDSEADDTFVLCGMSNCRHSNSGCPAWYNGVGNAVGLALYGKTVYVIKRNEADNVYELLSMDISGSSQKVVYSMDIGEFAPESWELKSIDDVHYVNGRAWFSIQYAYSVKNEYGVADDGRRYSKIIGVDLSDGTASVLCDLPGKADMEKADAAADCSIAHVSRNYAVALRQWNSSEALPQEDFSEAFGRGEFQEFKDSPDPYYDYLLWCEAGGDYRFEYILYDTQNNARKVIDSGQSIVLYEDDGRILGTYPPYSFSGAHEDKLLLSDHSLLDPSGKRSVYFYDPASSARELLLELENGDLLMASSFNHRSINSIIGRGKLLYCVFKADEKADVFAYNLKTKEREKLFEDHERITFRLVWEGTDKYYGLLQNFGRETEALCSIEKAEYHKGNFNAAQELF